MKRLTSWLLVFAFMLSMIPTAFAAGGSERESAAPTKIDDTTVWSYLDDNSDPAGDPTADGYDRTSWAAAGFDDSEWTSAAGPFGTKNGSLHTGAATKLNGCPGNENNYPTFYFRTKVTIEDASAVTKITGSISYDDAVILYINGVKAKGFNEAGCDSNSSFCTNVSNGNPASENFEITASSVLSALTDGENTVAVELHNRAGNSSDIFFGMSDMTFSTDPLETTAHQSNISLSMGGDESRMNFTWYSALENASLLISDSEDMTDALTIAATSDTADGQYSCKAEVGDLKPGTTYYYQLENDGNKSGVYHFTTGGSGDFSFAFVGDPQIGASGNAGSDTTGWGKTLDLIKTDDRFSDVSFLLSAGDQVDTHNNENQYDGYLDHDVLTGLPSATVIGNHDSASDTYSKHFNVANESSQYGKTNAGGDSYFVYNKTLFLVLNSNNLSTADHRQFMLDSISAVEDQDIQWKIVVFHHSVYSVASHAVDKDILSRRDALVPVFKELDIDAVLMGHDHVYVRSYMMDGLQPMTDASIYDDEDYSSITDPTGILYVTANSASGSKFYTIKDTPFEYAAVQNQERVPNVSKVSVGEDHFTVTTYRTSDMSVVDTFTINRTSSQETGYPVTFASDGYAAIDVYNTQDYTTPSKTNVDSAVARNPNTGEIDMTGDGQVNFKVNVAEGREIDKVEADKNYRNLKDLGGGFYRLTRIEGPVTVTVTTKSASTEPTYTPAKTGDTRVQGFYNTDASLKLELAGRYNSNAMSESGGSLEIVQYNSANGFAYAVSGVKGTLIAVDLNNSMDGDKVAGLDGKEYDIRSTVSSDSFTYGDMTSVAISPDGSKLAAAIQAEGYADNGIVALFSCNDDGTLSLINTVTVGVQPDMVIFSDNNTILTADEGEPRQGSLGTDPKGSVTVVTIESGAMTADTVTFDDFDSRRTALTDSGVLIQKGFEPSTDFEPEYIAVSGGKAYVSLQENNAIAVLDIAAKAFTGVYPLGFQNFGETMVDLENNGTAELKTYDGIYGIRMPDGISVITIGGQDYLLTANEGDSRSDWPGMDNEVKDKSSPTGNKTLSKKVTWFNASMWDGLDQTKAYVFGGRSFSIYKITDSGLTLISDSGSDFEEITAEKLKDHFNCTYNDIAADDRSGKKGPEPETVITGTVNGKTYAFIALERIGGVMVYDITDPANISFINYINSREFEAPIQGDVSPEGMCFIPAANGRKAMVLTACEVSGTLAAYELTPAQDSSSDGDHTGGSGSGSGSSSSTGSKPSTSAPEQNESSVGFKDVPKNAYYFDAVEWAVKQQITSGTSAAEFDPDAPCTRAQIVTFLWRAAGSPEPKTTGSFIDVPSGSYYEKAVSWAVEKGITTGVSSERFDPNAACTRAQAVTFLYRALGSQANAKAWFSDVHDGSYYAGAVDWAVENGVTNGISETLFGPDNSCTRAQIVTFLYRAAA